MTFQNLTEQQINQLYEELKQKGLNDDEIFNEIYSIDCNLDTEN